LLYGAERRLLDIIENLDHRKFEAVVLLSQEGPFAEKLKDEGIETVFLDFKFKILFKNIGRFFEITKTFLWILKEYRIDIVHVNLHYLTSNLWLAFLLSRKPVIMHLRAHVWLAIFEKFVMARCARIICVSDFVRRSFFSKRRSDFIVSANKDRLEVLYDGIDVEKFSADPEAGVLRQELAAGNNEKLVGMISAIDPIKGQDIFILAARRVCDKYPKTRFVIVGELYCETKKKKEFKERLIRLIEKLGLEKNVHMFGFRENIPEIMNSIDILVQPSAHEALGTSLVEAMACKKPVIGSSVDGIPEVIGSDGAGVLLETRTPQALAEAVLFYLERPQEAQQAGIIARKRVEEIFDMKKNVSRLESIYHKLAKR